MPAWVLLASHLASEDVEAEQEAKSTVVESFEEKELKVERKKKNGIKILDATAAPGNKTTMAAALAGEHGRVVAVERDAGRYKVLKEMCQKAGCKSEIPVSLFMAITCSSPSRRRHADERRLPFHRPARRKVQEHFPLPRRPIMLYVSTYSSPSLLDADPRLPFTAGSGIPSRLDHLLPSAPEEEAKQRIRALSNFQLTILSHAMRFTGARRVVYSTCSIWSQEDEGVIMRVRFPSLLPLPSPNLLTAQRGNRYSRRRSSKTRAGRSHPGTKSSRRGTAVGDPRSATATRVRSPPSSLPSSLPPLLTLPPRTPTPLLTAIADSVVRALPEDGTNGFFVACLIRTVPEGFVEDEPAVMAEGGEVVEGGEGDVTMSHASRQEAFKAKARAKGGKGGSKGPKVEKVEKVRAPVVMVKAEKVKGKKVGVPGKKAKCVFFFLQVLGGSADPVILLTGIWRRRRRGVGRRLEGLGVVER